MLFENKPFTIREALMVAVSFLSEKGIISAQNEAIVLLEHLSGIEKTQLFMLFTERINDATANQYEKLLTKRAEGVPLQYLTGKQEFMSLSFDVSPDVLIPRPETEILVEKALAIAKNYSYPPKIIDVCTGSGCIITSICYYLKKGIFLAADISKEALGIAYKNCAKFGLENAIHFYEVDLLNHPDFTDADIILSNPPYIASAEIPELQREVSLYEPHLALNGGTDGLKFYRKLIPKAHQVLKTGGWLVVEVGWDQGERVRDLFKKSDFSEIEVYQDFSGHDRVVCGRKN